MAQLLIQNAGEAPEESYTLIGASLSRSDDGLLGQFGSGSKLAICTLLRMGKRIIVYCGKTRMEFKTRTIEISDDMESQQKERVYVQYGGTSTRKEDLGWVVDMGALDWECNLDMAIREFVANAIDHTVKRGDNLQDAKSNRDLCVEIVPDGLRKAQKGYTRVYIESCDKCEEYVNALPRKFLQFSNQPLDQPIMSKINPLNKKVQVYLCGAFVCELKDSADSMFDYNFNKVQIQIDESRNLGEYAARAAIARLLRNAPADILKKIFRALEAGTACLETGIDCYYLKPDYYGATDLQKATWKAGWEAAHGEDYVIANSANGVVAGFAKRKGYSVGQVCESGWVDVAQAYGIKTISDVLDCNERIGRSVTGPTSAAENAFKRALGWLAGTGLDIITKSPVLRGFDEDDSVEIKAKGFIDRCEVGIRNDLTGSDAELVALEYLVKYFSGTDSPHDTLLSAVARIM